MPRHRYLHRQDEYFHFRRRIPGLSTSIRPVQVALGTTDENFAHTCVRTLIAEFDAVLVSFLFVIDPLPEQLVARYMRTRLQVPVQQMRRQRLMERMTGRQGAAENSREFHRAVLTSLLADGIGASFPCTRIDRKWSPDELENVAGSMRMRPHRFGARGSGSAIHGIRESHRRTTAVARVKLKNATRRPARCRSTLT